LFGNTIQKQHTLNKNSRWKGSERMDKITEVRIEEVKDFEENKHFWRIYYTKNEKIIILGESRVKPQLTRVVAIYK
jgi:hypothetical protein